MDDNSGDRPKTYFDQVPISAIKTVLRKKRPAIIRETPVTKTEPYSVSPTMWKKHVR
jgi:hypothetical protein